MLEVKHNTIKEKAALNYLTNYRTSRHTRVRSVLRIGTYFWKSKSVTSYGSVSYVCCTAMLAFMLLFRHLQLQA